MPNIRKSQCNIHPALRSLIRHIVIIEADFGNIPFSIKGNFMLSPDQAMFINLNTQFQSKKAGENNFNAVTSCTLIGAQITPFKLVAEESHTSVSIIFHPGGLTGFLNIPLTEIFDDGYSARAVIGREIDELLDRSHDTISLAELDKIVQTYLLKKITQIKEPLPIDYALQHLLVNHNASMDQIAGMACMSLRSFERKCKERLGMSAKMYARIARFHKAYKMLEETPTISGTALAYEAGYYDQMHFLKDFKEFAKLTPRLVSQQLSAEDMQFQFDYNNI